MFPRQVILQFLILYCSNIFVHAFPSSNEHKLGIIHGAEVDSAPFMVHINLFSAAAKKPALCGGTVLSEKYVLSAAHCFFNHTPYVRASLLFGVHNVSNASEPHRIERNVTLAGNLVIHPDSRKRHDLAIITLQDPVSLSEFISAVVLPSKAEANETYENKSVSAYGWGVTEVNGDDDSDVLLTVTQFVVDNVTCKGQFSAGKIQDYHLCVSAIFGDTCQGDSGGPLLIGDKQVAVISWGIGCYSSRHPSVGVKLGPHLDWISSNTGIEIKDK